MASTRRSIKRSHSIKHRQFTSPVAYRHCPVAQIHGDPKTARECWRFFAYPRLPTILRSGSRNTCNSKVSITYSLKTIFGKDGPILYIISRSGFPTGLHFDLPLLLLSLYYYSLNIDAAPLGWSKPPRPVSSLRFDVTNDTTGCILHHNYTAICIIPLSQKSGF